MLERSQVCQNHSWAHLYIVTFLSMLNFLLVLLKINDSFFKPWEKKNDLSWCEAFIVSMYLACMSIHIVFTADIVVTLNKNTASDPTGNVIYNM